MSRENPERPTVEGVLVDGEGYPTEMALDIIRAWKMSAEGLPEWFAFIRRCWWMPDWGWSEREAVESKRAYRVYHISTGGWSGNESIIEAMRENTDWCWYFSWWSSRRGGHYEFRIPAPSTVGRPPSTAADGSPQGDSGPKA